MAAATPAAAGAIPKGTAAALQLVKCKVSASLLPGNLVVGSDAMRQRLCSKHYAYIHRSEVALVETRLVALGVEKAADSIRVAYVEKDPVNQIDFVKLAAFGEVLVVVNQAGGVFLFDEGGQKLLHSYKHSRASGPPLTLKEQHMRGIACDGKEWLYVGTGSGEILALQVTKSKISLGKVIPAGEQGHNEASATGGGVSALVYSAKDTTLVSADDWGNVLFWPGVATGDALGNTKPTRLEGKGSPVNALVSGHGVVASASASGHVRLYDAAKRILLVEIAAHTRAINGLDMHHSKPMLLAAGEDTFVSVWSLPSAASPQVKSLLCESPALGLLTGGRFGGKDQELIVNTIYDSRALALMHTP